MTSRWKLYGTRKQRKKDSNKKKHGKRGVALQMNIELKSKEEELTHTMKCGGEDGQDLLRWEIEQ